MPVLVLLALLSFQEPASIDRLRDLAELGLQGELVAAGRPLVTAGGDLERDGEAASLVARALFATGREDEAFQLLAAARPADASGRAQVQLARARLLLERDSLEKALALLVERPGDWSRPRHPSHPDNLLLLGRALVRSDRHDLAEPTLRRLVELAPLHPEGPAAWHMLFDCAVRRGDLERAQFCRAEKQRLARWHALVTARRLQVRRDPEALLPRLGLALLWIEVERFDEARSALDALLARDPAHVEAWLHLGEVHRRAGRGGAALTAYERTLELDPGEQRARYSLALLNIGAGRADRARVELEILVSSEAANQPAFLGAHLELARLLKAAGDAAAAEARHARYLELGGEQSL